MVSHRLNICMKKCFNLIFRKLSIDETATKFTSLRLVARHSAGRTFGLNVTQTQRILSYWINADGAKVLGKKEQHGFRLLHALYAIPSFRLLLLLSYPYNLKQLHVVLTHLYSSESSRYQLVESRKRLKSTDLDLLTLG
ncbi:unnamed protein product [Albugo candida]|uniref:Uncharacterized protein n=1 Tax=Albugo candida TaxID=65357 RepID=A0A024GUM0_9STRA|nr:unnamed protein product [Albugo candida]|eukprot:CCI50466.1 unnamed protein product [Albugo candida]